MSDFAQLNAKNIVKQVIVVDDATIADSNGRVSEYVGVSFCQQSVDDFSTVWRQTSNTMRGNPAGIGMTYMTNVQTLGVASTDIFINDQPYASWGIGKTTASWISGLGDAPGLTTTQQANGQCYKWDEVAHQADSSTPKTVGWALTTL